MINPKILFKQLATLLTSALIASSTLAQREIIDFNFDWNFYLGDQPEAVQPSFDDSEWRSLNLPHDWSIEQNYTTENTGGSTGFLPAGIGWYRKTFDVPESDANKTFLIEFDGAYHNAEVWINGHYLGIRPYGYSVFGYELSEHINIGEENVITVKIDHSDFLDSRWYTGSGIYRDVRLITTSKLYIPQFGAWAETPQVTESQATVKITTKLKHLNATPWQAEVHISLKAPNGEIVANATSYTDSKNQPALIQHLTVKSPELWGIDTPNIYTADIEIVSNGKVQDTYSFDFGIRSFHFDANKGFFLNDENIKLKGVCLHHDAGAVGGAFIRDVWKRRLQTLKDIGVNAIRSSHNPAAPGFLKLCDEMGFVVINEAFDEWKQPKNKWVTSRFVDDIRPELKSGYSDIFEEWAERDVKNLVRYSRNNPSIIMWSIGNEIEWTYPYYFKMEKSNQGLANQVLTEETGDGRDELKETAEQLMAWIKEVDTTRPVTTGGVLPRAGNTTGYFDVPDVMGYNYRAVAYDDDHAAYPERIIYGSENWGTYQEWKDATDRDFIAGIFLWTGIAYLGESGPFPWKGLDISLLDFAGLYTPRGHFFKTLWNEEPYTYIGTKNAKEAQWALQDGEWKYVRLKNWLDKWLFEDVSPTWNYSGGDDVFVEVYSNAAEVELFVNDKSFGIQSPADFPDNIVKYQVPYAAGNIRAVGLENGKVTSEKKIKTAKKFQSVQLIADRETMTANGYDVVHIEAQLTTKSGEIVPDAKAQIEFTIEGEGRNIGVDNGWDRNVQKHKSNYIVTHNGKALLLVQSTQAAGPVKITARCGSLESNIIIVNSTAPSTNTP